MTALGTRHPEADGICPTGCGRKVRSGHLMCGPCWSEVPGDLQRDVLRTWRAYSRSAAAGADDFPERGQAYEAARTAALEAVTSWEPAGGTTEYDPDDPDPCEHDWTLRPESDTWVCEMCGAER